MTQHSLPDRRLRADPAFQGISPDGCHQFKCFGLIVILKINFNPLSKSCLIVFCSILHDFRRADHPFQITDPAFILVFFLFCRMVFEIFTQIPMGSGFLHRFQLFFPDDQLPVFDFLFHFFNIFFRQFIIHDIHILCPSAQRLRLY